VRYDIFLSYSHVDAAWAEQLHRRLTRFKVASSSLRVFFDTTTIAPGESIPRAVSEALQEAHHLVIVLTPGWIASEWTKLESEVAIWGDPAAERRAILPLLVKDCRPPPVLERLKYIDFRNTANYEHALRELVHTVRANIRHYGEYLITTQEQNRILSDPILPWLGFGGPSFDFLWPEMIIDPVVRPRRRPGPERRLFDWVAQRSSIVSSSVAVIGDPGVGKTTALRTMFLRGGSGFPHRRLYVHARDLTAKLQTLLDITADDSISLVVIVDGIDEAGADNIANISGALAELNRPNIGIVLASRTDFFDRQYEILQEGLTNLSEILELRPWAEGDVLDFTSRYAERIGDPNLLTAVRAILATAPGALMLLGNPMQLTLLLYLLAAGARVDAVTLREPYSLYDTFYREWIKKERSRGTGGGSPDIIKKAHIKLARWLYRYRGEVTNILRLLLDLDLEDASALLLDSAFIGLLTVDDSDKASPILVSFRHETLGEFLISQDILDAFQDGADKIPYALRMTVGDDVNQFVRSGMVTGSRRLVQHYLDNLSASYRSLLLAENEDGLTAPGAAEAERVREQILYYIGRLPIETMPEILRTAYTAEPSPLLRRSAALGAIIHGDIAIEREYMQRLEQPEEALLNRSVQLVYFGDVNDDLHTFRESGQEWSRTRSAIYKRLQGRDRRDLRLRWWDLRTLRSFYESRGAGEPVSEEQVDVLRNLYLEDPSSKDRAVSLGVECQLLLAVLGLD
jgi:TIR domain